MRFLRHSKYSIVRAREELQFYLSCPKRHPEYFGNFDVNEAKLSALCESNFALIMPEVDEDGCRILILRAACVDTEEVSGNDIRRLFFMFDEIEANMEEIQIAGLKVIFDMSNSMKFLSVLTPRDYKSLARSLQTPHWIHLKAFYILNLPSFAVHISNFLIKFVKEKMKKRIKFIRNKIELKDHIDVTRLLEEYGGKVTIEESRTYLKELLEEMRDKISYLDKIDADFDDTAEETSNSSEFEFGPIGSFKKLEID